MANRNEEARVCNRTDNGLGAGDDSRQLAASTSDKDKQNSDREILEDRLIERNNDVERMSDDNKCLKKLTLDSVVAMSDNELRVSPFSSVASSPSHGDHSNSEDWETMDDEEEDQ